MRVFSQVVESGSFSSAAARLGLSTTAASRHVAELEAHLQTRLLNRTTRRVSLTESGRAFYERSVQLLADLGEAEQEASSAAVVPRGTIRLTTSVNFGVRHVAPAIAEFMARHPEVRFDVSLSDRVVDLVEEGLDLAIRIGPPGPDNLVARRRGAVARCRGGAAHGGARRSAGRRARRGGGGRRGGAVGAWGGAGACGARTGRQCRGREEVARRAPTPYARGQDNN